MTTYTIDYMNAEMGIIETKELISAINIRQVLQYVLDMPIPDNTISITIIDTEQC